MTLLARGSMDATWAWTRAGDCAPVRSSVLDGFEVRVTRASYTDVGTPESDRLWPGRIRRLLRIMLRAWDCGASIDSATLLATELWTNALQHGHATEIGLRVWLTATHLGIEVDDGTPWPSGPPPAAGLLDEHGRGLSLVAAMADDWGVSSSGTHTWCLLTTPTSWRA